MTQLIFFSQDIKRMLGKYKVRVLTVWLSRVFWGILAYRIERGLYLLLPKSYKFVRVPFIPILNLIRMYSNLDIPYKANILGGLIVLHPSIGVVISGQVTIGKNLTLTGGNVIGSKKSSKKGEFVIGDNCSFGANSTLIGPIIIGNNITIGSLACVVKNCISDNLTLVGVPAKELKK
jgi:serine acetyltransferase